MLRFLLGVFVLGIGMAAAIAYNGIAREEKLEKLILEGDKAVLSGQPYVAIESYSGALALDPSSMALYLKRGEAYRRQGDLLSARRDLIKSSALDPVATRPHERLGDVSFALEKFSESISHYTDYIRIDDQSARVLYKLALANERDGRVNSAVPLLRRALSLDPEFAEAHYLLAVCLKEQNRVEDAKASVQFAIDLSPVFFEARELLAELHGLHGEVRKALHQLDALAALGKNDPESQILRGLAYAKADESELALLVLKQAKDDYPNNADVYLALGQLWLDIAERRGDLLALRSAREMLHFIPRSTASSRALMLLGRSYLVEGRVDLARHFFLESIDEFPVEPSAFLQLAWIEEAKGDWVRGRDLRRNHRLLTKSAQ